MKGFLLKKFGAIVLSPFVALFAVFAASENDFEQKFIDGFAMKTAHADIPSYSDGGGDGGGDDCGGSGGGGDDCGTGCNGSCADSSSAGGSDCF